SIAAKEREVLLPVSARSPEALRAAAEDLAAALEREGGPSLADAAWTQLARRSHHPWRAAIVARTSAEAARALRAEDAGASARASKREPLVWLFTGMGPQWWGMGQELHAREPVYRAAVERADAIFRRLSGWSLV